MNNIVPDRVGVFDDMPKPQVTGNRPQVTGKTKTPQRAAAPQGCPATSWEERAAALTAADLAELNFIAVELQAAGDPRALALWKFLGEQVAPGAAIPRLQPLHDRVLVRRSHEQASSGTIIIPDLAREKALRGVVIAVGPGAKDADGVFHETMVKTGDVVVFSGSVNVPYPDLVEDGELVMMREADILGIVQR